MIQNGRSIAWALGPWLVAGASVSVMAGPSGTDPLARFDLPDEWEARFWADPGTKAFVALGPKDLAERVPVQAGFRYCRCPSCGATEADDPLVWSAEHPDQLTCRRCSAEFPNEKVPVKVPPDPGKPPEVPSVEIEVLHGVHHNYPYHVIEADLQRYPEERVFLAAKRDYEAREFLTRFALYSAAGWQSQPPGSRDPAQALRAAVLVLRFAQVYPAYATHYDQPNEPKYLQRADLKPPYRRGYRTGKWDSLGAQDVPLDLLIAYALIRSDPAALTEAGRLLDDPNPARTIERDLFRASATFVRNQPEEYLESSLFVYRGMLAVGRLLGDADLVHEALGRLEGFAERGFTHDGLWRQGDAVAHRRVVTQIDGWINWLLAGYSDPPGYRPRTGRPLALVPGSEIFPVLTLARSVVGPESGADSRADGVLLASWPAPTATKPVLRRAVLLGGAGLARLAIGQGDDALDLELRGLGSLAAPHFDRQALRLTVGGQPVLGDLADGPSIPNGFHKATASSNTILVNGRNQRETPARAAEHVPGGNFLFFAADPDFQVVTLDDPHAYPESTTRYRQTVVASAGSRTRYAVAVFEVHGGHQHDQFFQAAAGSPARWQAGIPLRPGPRSLLPHTIPYLPDSPAQDGRWFVQAYGAFSGLSEGQVHGPALVALASPKGTGPGPGLRLHLLGDLPATLYTGIGPDPKVSASDPDSGRAALVIRRESGDETPLTSTFVTVFDPVGSAPPLQRVGRGESPPGSVVLVIQTVEGTEHLVINLKPGTALSTQLIDGRSVRTDGLVLRVRSDGLALAGGTFAEVDGERVEQARAAGSIVGAARELAADSRGWFEADGPLEENLAGRVLLIRHGDGTTHGWTLARVENLPSGRARLYVREEPGFLLDHHTQAAAYYQFPCTALPGPHRFVVARLVRSSTASPPGVMSETHWGQAAHRR